MCSIVFKSNALVSYVYFKYILLQHQCKHQYLRTYANSIDADKSSQSWLKCSKTVRIHCIFCRVFRVLFSYEWHYVIIVLEEVKFVTTFWLFLNWSTQNRKTLSIPKKLSNLNELWNWLWRGTVVITYLKVTHEWTSIDIYKRGLFDGQNYFCLDILFFLSFRNIDTSGHTQIARMRTNPSLTTQLQPQHWDQPHLQQQNKYQWNVRFKEMKQLG